MNSTEPRILVVDDDPEMVSILCDVLREAGYIATGASSGVEALEVVDRDEPDLVISDLRMSQMNGHQLQAELKRRIPHLPVIVITAFGSIANAVESMKLGASDYLTKPFGNDELLLVVSRALENRYLRREIRRLRGELAGNYGPSNIVASNPRVLAILETIRQVADLPATVLLLGESGTGKEMFARALHFTSSRRDAPFIPVNCAAVPESLIESEMFGYVKGAFTDARSQREGLFQAAHGGTLFLDEIADMPVSLQAKLLRVIEDKRVRPLGSNTEKGVDVRIVAATNSDVEAAIKTGKFRADLYYRLATVTLNVPPLRERPEDLPLLLRHFLARSASECGKAVPAIDPKATECLMRYGWPGNIRELQNVVQSAVILCREGTITAADLPPRITGAPDGKGALDELAARRFTLDEVEREYVRAVLAQVSGNKTEAAAILQVDRKTLYRKLEEPYPAAMK
ncbi:MAG TPA: sigma-54 dependent transcriptional regulator [Candidatus Binataceae bacterium]|nr:sigma-54 dependent transcriptional regulator [Candidatus Binataceae bacterium]